MNEPIMRLLSRPGTLPADLPTLLRKLGWAPTRRAELQSVLHTEEREGRLVRIKGDRYVRPDEAGLVTGRLRVNRSGRGWLLADDPATPEIAVAEAATGTALNEDRVLVRKDPDAQTGVVVRVLERRRTRFVGTLHRGKGVLRVVLDDPRIPHEFYVPEPKGSARRAKPGDKVVVELREWESRRANPEGEIVEVLGAPTDEGVDMLSVLRQYNLEKEFPKVVVDSARAHGDRIRERDLVGRVDCRAHRVVTIDPDDAKDFDDAICVERASGGGWKVWVHVADVAHYVKPGSPLDHEALERGNSTYLVDRVIPMLPEVLSNELCSLKPGVDRLTQCVEFDLAPEGRVKQARFHRAVIHSKRRYTYAEALAVLSQPARDDFDDMIQDASLLAQRLRRARFEAGALELGSSEIKIRLDARGHVLRLEKHLNDESHQLIEEFMLLANEAVAVRLGQMNRLALHRVHEEPDPRRLAEYRDEVRALGIECGDLRNRAEMRRLTDRIAKHPAGHALRVGLLRSLQRARYDVEPGGHFGLAKKHYTHFTSPIRRYSDLVIHRALAEGPVGDAAELNRLGRHLSDTERNSGDAERDSREIKLFHYLDGQIRHGRRHSYNAVITAVQPSGFVVDAPDLSIGGLVPVSSLEDDFYVLDAVRRCWVGRRRRKMFRVGDTVVVQVRKVDMAARRLDFELAPARPGATAPSRPSAAPVAAAVPPRKTRGQPGRPQSPARRPAPTPAPAPAPAPASRPPARTNPGRPQQPTRSNPAPKFGGKFGERPALVQPTPSPRPAPRPIQSGGSRGGRPSAPVGTLRKDTAGSRSGRPARTPAPAPVLARGPIAPLPNTASRLNEPRSSGGRVEHRGDRNPRGETRRDERRETTRQAPPAPSRPSKPSVAQEPRAVVPLRPLVTAPLVRIPTSQRRTSGSSSGRAPLPVASRPIPMTSASAGPAGDPTEWRPGSRPPGKAPAPPSAAKPRRDSRRR